MKIGTTNIKLNYKPLNAVKSLKTLSGSERQNYNADTLTFEPDRRIDPLVIMVECGVTDPHNLKNGNVNSDLNSVSWKISENGIFKDILESDSDFNIGKNSNKGQLKVFKNISDLEPVTIIFTAKYLEPISKRVVNFQENFDLITLPIAQTPLNLEATMPIGGTLFVNKNQDGLLTQAKLFRGIEQLPAAYYWYKGNTEITDTNGYIGSKTERLFVPSSEISSSGSVIRVEVANCSDYVNQLVNQKVQADSKVMEWVNLYKTEQENYLLNSEIDSFIFRNNNESTNNSLISYDTSEESWYVMKRSSDSGSSISIFSGILVSNLDRLPNFDTSQKHVYSIEIKCEVSIMVSIFGVVTGTKTIPAGKWTRINTSALLNSDRIFGLFVNTAETSKVINKKIFYRKYKVERGENSNPIWSPAKQDLNNLVAQKTTQYKSETKLPENYRPATKPSKTYKADFLLIKKFPEYQEEVLITQGGIDPSVSSVQAEMIIKTNDGLLQNPEKYFSVGWLKQTNETFKYKGFKVNISMADIVALNAENKELDYELREDLTLKA